MAQKEPTGDNDILQTLRDSFNNVSWIVKTVGSGDSAFTVLCLNSANATHYFWIDDGNDLTWSATEPTAITGGTTKVGAQS